MWFADAAHDLRFALRSLRSAPAFAVVAVLTLGVGIGATTAISSVVDTILLQPLPFTDADRLVRLVENVPSTVPGRPPSQRGVSHPEFLEWRARARTLADVFAIAGLGQRTVRTRDATARLWGGMISSHAFSMLGVRAAIGRTLQPDDDRHPDVVVLGFDAWRQLFHDDRGVLGSTIEIEAPEPMFRTGSARGRVVTVVGVLPERQELPAGPMDFLTPFAIDSAQPPAVRLIGLLRPGVSMPAAIDEANAIGAEIRPPRPANAPPLKGPRFDVLGVKEQIVQGLRPALRVLLAAVALMLAIVCANVANLLLVRATARRREIAVRFAIGASRGRVVRQVLTECAVLALAGGALGAVFGMAGIAIVKQLTSVEAPGIFRLVFGVSVLPRGTEIGVDVRTFGIAFGVAALASFAFGVLPAVQVSRTDWISAVASRGSTGRRESRARAALAVAQLAMATLLLVGGALLIRSLVGLWRVDRGFDPAHVLAFQLVVPPDYTVARKVETIEAVLARLRAAPSVASAGFTRAGMLLPEEIYVGTFVPRGRTLEEMRAEPSRPRVRPVSPGFLTAMGVRVLEGREFATADARASRPAIVIGRSVARQFFGERRAVGETVDWYVGTSAPVTMEVAGVVEDLRNESAERGSYPEVFVEYRQLLALQQRWGQPASRQEEIALGFLSFAVRTQDSPASAAPLVRQLVRAVDSNAGVDAVIPVERLVASSVARQRFFAITLGLFAAVAAFLAAIGVYGVLAYGVAQRTQEIGIRMALGARRAQVLGLVLRHGAVLTMAGLGLGLAGAAAATRVLEGLLFGVRPFDPATFMVVAAAFGLLAMAASYVPARRAANVDPMTALRSE
jgi:putative ABC transport system permease protein